MPQTIGKGIRSMGLRKIAAIWAAKTAEKLSVHIFHRQGVTWAGKIALKIYPQILEDLASQVRKDILSCAEQMEKIDDQQYALRSAGSRRK